MYVKKNNLKSEEGFILVLCLILLVIMVAIGSSVLFSASNQVKQSSSWGDYQQTFYSAETALEDAKSWLEQTISHDSSLVDGSIKNDDCTESHGETRGIMVVKTDKPGSPRNNDEGYDDINTLNDYDLDKYKYSYYIEKVEGSERKGGANPGDDASLDPGGPSSSSTYITYKVYICAFGPDEREKSNITALIEVKI